MLLRAEVQDEKGTGLDKELDMSFAPQAGLPWNKYMVQDTQIHTQTQAH